MSRLRKPAEEQKMVCLPEVRLNPAPTFSYSAVDFYGPFIINVKRYGVLLTCMGSRSVHLETINSLDKSFYESQRRSETTEVRLRSQLHWCSKQARNSLIRDESRPLPRVLGEK